MKTSDMSTNGKQYHTKTHLGRLLNIGDTALGFDLANANVNDDNFDAIKPENLPDVVLVKKLYGDKLKRHKNRKWKLNRLNMDKEGGSVATIDDKDYLDFLEDLEEDPKARENVNIYKDERKVGASEEPLDESENFPKIELQEMIDELNVRDEPMDE
jgi:nonsense-mediated mRNA decay protein 3